jgi:V8-like Glu-specific endopeptidase
MRFRVLFSMLVLSSVIQADEGMWVPQQLNEIAGPLKKAGLQLDPSDFADLTGQPMGAVVSIGGCTASFISPNGLVATNHHCAYGGIQLNSTPENNLLANGFVAKQLAEEVSSGPNSRIFVMDSITDITARMLASTNAKMTGLQRQQAMEKENKTIISECEKEPGYRCSAYAFFGGVQYRLFKQIEIKDVRLVYAPPSSIGNYGGEVDNWMWPRHTGDFSLIRAYVGKDGKPAAFSKDNIPYQNKQWLKVSNTPLQAGDFVMVAGYPGRTNRYALADEFDNTQNWAYPFTARNLKNVRDLVHAKGKENPDIAIKYASTVKNWENVLKNYDGQLLGFQKSNASVVKRQEEKAILEWLTKQGASGKAGLNAHKQLVALAALDRQTQVRDSLVGQVAGIGLIGSARNLYRLAIEKTKANAERAPGYQDRDISRIEGGVKEFQNRYHPDMEKQLLTYWLTQYITLPSSDRNPAIDKWLQGNDTNAIQKAVNQLYAETKLGQLAERQKLLSASTTDFESSADPVVQLAVALYPSMLALENTSKERTGEYAKHRPEFMKANIAYKQSQGLAVYPDANSSLRITYGNITGYTPQDGAVYTPFTTAEGVSAKATSVEPFDAPKVLLDKIKARDFGPYYDKKLGTLPVNFLSNLDITGGNSGSPVMNAKGELVGLAFDGNWESVSSNWVYDGTLNRMISVDSRYMMWIIDKVYPAPNIIMEIKNAYK